MTIVARCISANRTVAQEVVTFEPVQAKPATPPAPAPAPAPAPIDTANMSLIIRTPENMGQFTPGREYSLTVG